MTMHSILRRTQLTSKRIYCLVVCVVILGMCLVFYSKQPALFITATYGWDQPAKDVPISDHGDSFVPNFVHFVKLGDAPLSFIEVVCIRAAWLQQSPAMLMIHCDVCNSIVESPHWRHVKDIPRLSLRYVERPKTIFGTKVSWIQHASDIVRIRILRKYGGTYLDKDSYLIKSLDKYRRYEAAIGWPPGQNIGSQVIVGHKQSEFLRLYYESYHKYRPDLWYYNAGQLPTKEILGPKPHLVHRVPHDFGVHEDITKLLYMQCNDDWRNYTAVHTFFRLRTHYCPSDKFGPVDFDTIGKYATNFGQMARLVLTGSTKLGESTVKNITLLDARNLDYSQGCR